MDIQTSSSNKNSNLRNPNEQLTQDYKTWDINNVYNWAAGIIGEKNAIKFKENEITGVHLNALTDSDIKSILPLGPAISIISAIKNLNPEATPIDTKFYTCFHEGISISDETTIKREKKLVSLVESLNETGLVQIIAPPQSGKTSLGQLFENFVISSQPNSLCKRVNLCWDSKEKSFQTFWTKFTGYTFQQLIDLSFSNNVYIIIDEAQISYNSNSLHNELWTILKGNLSKLPKAYHILFLGSYRIDRQGNTSTPIASLPSKGLEFLNYDADEFKEVFKTTKVKISKDVQQLLWEFTNGQIGVLYTWINRLEMNYISCNKYCIAYQDLCSQDFFNYFTSNCRTYTPIYMISNESALKVLKDLIYTTIINKTDILTITFDQHEHLDIPIKSGIIIPISETQYKFSTPICKFYYQIASLITLSNSSGPYLQPTNLKQYIIKTIEYLDATKLLKKSSHRVHNQMCELRWHIEFYRAAASIFPLVYVTPYFDDKMVDLFVDGNYKWALEFTSDGINVNDHYSRFMNKGIYYGIAKDWAVVDFRHHSTTISESTMLDNVYYVKYSDDFKIYSIITKGRQPLTIVNKSLC